MMLAHEYALGLARSIRKAPKDYGMNPDKVAMMPEQVDAYARSLAAKMLASAKENGAKSINLSDVLRGALTRTGYASTYAGFQQALDVGYEEEDDA